MVEIDWTASVLIWVKTGDGEVMIGIDTDGGNVRKNNETNIVQESRSDV